MNLDRAMFSTSSFAQIMICINTAIIPLRKKALTIIRAEQYVSLQYL